MYSSEDRIAQLQNMKYRLDHGYSNAYAIRSELNDLEQTDRIRNEVADNTLESRKAILANTTTDLKLLALDVNPRDLVQTRQLTFLFNAHKDTTAEIDYLLDMKSLLRRAEGGTKFANVRAQFLVGMGYHQGRFGFPVNLKEAEKWFSKVEDCSGTDHEWLNYCTLGYYAQHGLSSFTKGECTAQLGYISHKDKYIPVEYLWVTDRYESSNSILEDARASYAVSISDCVKAGFVPAIAFLGMRYLTDGWCVEVDPTEGLRLLKIAATQGDAPSRFYLGEMYRQGLHGVNIDPVEAQQWYQLAKSQNYPDAREALKLLPSGSSSSSSSNKRCSIM